MAPGPDSLTWFCQEIWNTGHCGGIKQVSSKFDSQESNLETVSPSTWISLHHTTIFFFLAFLGPHPWHMEVPRLGFELELQLLAFTTATATATQDPSRVCNLHHSLWQHWVLNPLSKARDQTCILTDASQIHFLLSHYGNSIFFLLFNKGNYIQPEISLWPMALLYPLCFYTLCFHFYSSETIF